MEGGDDGGGSKGRAAIVHQSERDPHKSIFCGGLPLEVDDNALAAAFSVHGEVEAARVVRDKATGWSKGYGFIVFADKDVAERLRSAAKACIGGRAVDIGPALRGIGKGSRSESKCGQSDSGGRKVFVGGLPRHADESAMRWFFSSFGWCEDFKIVYDSTSGASKGYGFATFADKDAAERLKNMQHVNFNGSTLNVNEASVSRSSSQEDLTSMRGTCSDGSAQHSLFSPSFFTGPASMWAAQHSNGPLDSSVFSPALGSLATDDPHHTIFCGGFAASVTERDLVLLFSQFGPVSRARVITDSRTNQSKGYGFITFASAEGCLKALEQRKVELSGRQLDVGPAKRRSNRQSNSRGSFGDSNTSLGDPSFASANDMAKMFPSTALHV